MIPYCQDQGIAVTAFSPLRQGLAVGQQEGPFSDRSFLYRISWRRTGPQDHRRVEDLAAEHGVTKAEVALAWLYSKDAVCCPIIGASSVSQIEKTSALSISN